MKHKVLLSEKKLEKMPSRQFRRGVQIGRDVGAHEMSKELASVVGPILDSALNLHDHGLHDYAALLLIALREKAAEIAFDDEDDGEDGNPGDAFAASFDALESLVAQLQHGAADHVEPVQDGSDPL